MRFLLFGQELSLPFSGPIGGLVNHAEARLAPGNQILSLGFEGELPGGRATFQVDFPCRVEGDLVLLLPPASPLLGRKVEVQFPLGLTGLVIENPPLFTGPGFERLGVAFADRDRQLRAMLRGIRISDSLKPLNWTDPSEWAAHRFSFDLPARTNVFLPAPGATQREIRVTDVLPDAIGRTGPKREQFLAVQRVEVASGGITVLAEAIDRFLAVHPDILDTRGALVEGNEILFQHVLVNGLLEIALEGAQGQQRRFTWRGRNGTEGEQPGLVAFRLADEHGHPLLLEADQFPLHRREGIASENMAVSSANAWEKTLPAIVVDPGHAPISLRSLDPASVSLDSPDPERKWLKDGRAVAGRVPREIHGLAKGTFLEWTGPAEATHADGSLRTSTVEVPGLGRLFTQTELVLDDVANWKLRAQLEERDVYAKVAPRPDAPFVGLREAAPLAGELRVPLIDTSYALANLVDETGKVQQGHIAANAVAWVHELDQQFVARFEAQQVAPQTHVSGFEVAALEAQQFQSVLDLPPGRASSAAATARTGVVLKPSSVDYVHGDRRDESTRHRLRLSLQNSADFGANLQTFQAFWYSRSLSPAEAQARQALREFMGESRPKKITAEDLQGTLHTAVEILYGNRTLETFAQGEINTLRTRIAANMTLQAFKTLWETTADPLIVAFLDALWSPANPALYRRAVSALSAKDLETVRALLEARIQAFTPTEDLKGFLSPTVLGVDPIFATVADLWRTANGLEELRRKHGFSLTPDAYQRLLRPEFAADLRKLFDEMKSAHPELVAGLEADPNIAIDFLRRLSTEPPDYIFFTRRFPLTRTQRPDDLWDRLWNHQFQLCEVGAGNSWLFLLDGDSSVIVKLTGQRKIEDILKEAEENYKSAGRPNPLGLPRPLEEFVAGLDPDIRRASWRGVLIIRPTADISQDEQLRTLAGLIHFHLDYVALGGATPEAALEGLDVYARIFQEKEAQPPDAAALGDVSLTLIKFDATIKNTRLQTGEVIFRLDVRNLWGKEKDFQEIMVRGTLPREKEGESTGGRSFEFAAWLPEPAELEIDLAFVKSFIFRALRVATNKGQTAVEIDGDVVLQKWEGLSLPGLGDGFSIDLGGLAERIGLQNFRILVPKLGDGKALRMGLPRLLNFEFPALSFSLPRPRVLNLWGGIELKPFGMGLLRRINLSGLDLEALLGRYQWLHEFKPGIGDFTFPYLRCEIDFGKLPKFGGTGLSRLKLELLIGLVIKGFGELPSIALGLGGLDAKDIRIDLFGVVKLEIERLLLGLFEMQDGKKAAAIHVRDPRLTILGWSPLPESAQLQLLFAQARGLEDGRAVLGWYADSNRTDRFFQLYWLLLAHNLAVDPKILTHLLGSSFDENAPKLLDGLVDVERKKIAARVTGDDSWLLGASFRLGEIVEQGTFILHDQHYYGISLRGKFVQILFGLERLELAYIPGPSRDLDRFRTSFRLPALDLLGPMRSGEIALEWGFNWDFLLDFGFPWKQRGAYLWERAFTLPVGTYEARFGLYFEKKTQPAPAGTQKLVLAAGAGFYLGYGTGFGTPGRGVWARAGIGVFAILEGRVIFKPAPANASNPLKGGIEQVHVRGVVGIWAYGEGGIEVWVLSARFRVSVQAAIAGELRYLPAANSTFSYEATLSASYSASCRVGSGFFSFTFEVSGHFDFSVSGQLLLN